MVAVELVESAPVYTMLTQMVMVRFLRVHDAELGGVLSHTVRNLGAGRGERDPARGGQPRHQIGRASCRERVFRAV